jgi:hypothetical protein
MNAVPARGCGRRIELEGRIGLRSVAMPSMNVVAATAYSESLR